ncbi:indole-3-glycerol phosphate synthase [Lentisphaera araneosa HTCC2155]|uniref:Indole-3-glycerol phosphate synthase n=1 Tax=Lentisphaera araneosa HTCC2155 TaxID=313628 RepID=A6DP07_9BACT|nr:indole-3-glycerol phosphate synthase TrpC [Lentisphaera araneosa]EDM26539.1 indole-3-glycerol phosphate synthase [Lentisphaera araneosa HTCC2155]
MNPADILKKIIATKHIEIKNQESQRDALKKAAYEAGPTTKDFAQALQVNSGLAVIAEVKKASPSAGVISADFDPVKTAKNYQTLGAAAISVLTDKDYFQGSIDYLKQIRQEVELPLLRKDFIIDELQIHEARVAGADTFLLIAAVLTEDEMRNFLAIGREFAMEALVEIHDEEEAHKALAAGAKIIGVNNRDLRNFTTDLSLTGKLAKFIPEDKILVGESGIKTGKDSRQLLDCGCSAILVGESLMRDPQKFKELQAGQA